MAPLWRSDWLWLEVGRGLSRDFWIMYKYRLDAIAEDKALIKAAVVGRLLHLDVCHFASMMVILQPVCFSKPHSQSQLLLDRMGQQLSQLTRPRVMVLTGPTCSGKTALSIDIAEKLNGEIISADSVQVYRGLDIGSSKISRAGMRGVRHHLIDICDPKDDFSAGRFYKEARAATEEILSRGKVPIVVGGTGFYLKWLVHGNAKTGMSTPQTRQRAEQTLTEMWLKAEASKGSPLTEDEKWEAGIEGLRAAGDPEAAERVAGERNNYYRLTRALEIVLSHEAAMTDLSVDTTGPLEYDFRCFFLHRPRLEIYERIEQRCEHMLHDGILTEALGLLECGLLPNQNCATRSIGYRQSMEFLLRLKNGETELSDEALVAFLLTFEASTRKLVKQQITWFRSEPLYHWIDLSVSEKDPKDLIFQKWAKFAPQGHHQETAPLSRAEEQALKRYVPKLHYYKDKEHRRELLENISQLLSIPVVPNSEMDVASVKP